MKNLLKCIGLVFKHGGFPALLLSITVITNGALAPLNVWIWQNIIDSVTENIGTGSLAHTGGEGGKAGLWRYSHGLPLLFLSFYYTISGSS